MTRRALTIDRDVVNISRRRATATPQAITPRRSLITPSGEREAIACMISLADCMTRLLIQILLKDIAMDFVCSEEIVLQGTNDSMDSADLTTQDMKFRLGYWHRICSKILP